MAQQTELSAQDIKAFEPEAKIGLLATVNHMGQPHISLITSLRARHPGQLTWGQFCEGESKNHVQHNPRTAFLVMNLQRMVWRGKATWTHSATQGEDYILYNQMPMFRYNSYFGIHTVHYMDLLELTEKRGLSMPRIIAGSLALLWANKLRRRDRSQDKLKPWAQGLLAKLDTLKFVAFVDADGYPVILPVVPCAAVDAGHLAFSPTVYGEELQRLRPGTQVSVFALNLQMESVLIRGPFAGLRRIGGPKIGIIDIDWVYNSMPPIPGQVYPYQKLESVTQF